MIYKLHIDDMASFLEELRVLWNTFCKRAAPW